MNVDYQQLTSDDKDDFKGKVRDILVESVNDPQVVIVVMLTPGSVKVLAEIQTPSEPESAVTSLKNNLDSLTRNVVKAANSVPGVKAAAFGELKITRVEVKIGELKVTPEERVSEAPEEAQDSSIGSPQPGTEAQAPGAPDEAQDETADEDDQLWQQNWFIIALAVCIPLSLIFLYILYAFYQKWAKQALKKESANGEAPVAPDPPPVVVVPEPPLVDAAPAATVVAYGTHVAPEEP